MQTTGGRSRGWGLDKEELKGREGALRGPRKKEPLKDKTVGCNS